MDGVTWLAVRGWWMVVCASWYVLHGVSTWPAYGHVVLHTHLDDVLCGLFPFSVSILCFHSLFPFSISIQLKDVFVVAMDASGAIIWLHHVV